MAPTRSLTLGGGEILLVTLLVDVSTVSQCFKHVITHIYPMVKNPAWVHSNLLDPSSITDGKIMAAVKKSISRIVTNISFTILKLGFLHYPEIITSRNELFKPLLSK